ncbi:MAG: hypothetical protein HYZ42_08900 [Bacteroidetes bacterium]|nr:hypothetical protein [Bacteroidota bacterium]
MAKPIHPKITEPCQEKWGRMSKTKRGRFCQSCEKVVVDFTKFSDQQLVDYFKTHKTGFCGNFYEDQLNRAYIDATPSSKFSINWQKYAAMLSTLFLGIGAASAQVKLMPKDSDQCETENR